MELINEFVKEPERQIVLPNWDTFMVYLVGATVTRWSPWPNLEIFKTAAIQKWGPIKLAHWLICHKEPLVNYNQRPNDSFEWYLDFPSFFVRSRSEEISPTQGRKREIFLLMICAIYKMISWKPDNHENYDNWRSHDCLLWFVLLVRCKREIDSGDVEVDVGQAGNGIVEL